MEEARRLLFGGRGAGDASVTHSPLWRMQPARTCGERWQVCRMRAAFSNSRGSTWRGGRTPQSACSPAAGVARAWGHTGRADRPEPRTGEGTTCHMVKSCRVLGLGASSPYLEARPVPNAQFWERGGFRSSRELRPPQHVATRRDEVGLVSGGLWTPPPGGSGRGEPTPQTPGTAPGKATRPLLSPPSQAQATLPRSWLRVPPGPVTLSRHMKRKHRGLWLRDILLNLTFHCPEVPQEGGRGSEPSRESPAAAEGLSLPRAGSENLQAAQWPEPGAQGASLGPGALFRSL